MDLLHLVQKAFKHYFLPAKVPNFISNNVIVLVLYNIFVAPGSATFRAAPEKPANNESLMRLLRGAELDGLLPI